MRLPRKIAGLLLVAATIAGVTAAAVPARASAATHLFFNTATQDSSGVWRFGNLCLEADPGPDFAYRVAIQPCDVSNNPAQRWQAIAVSNGVYKFVNEAVGWCLDTHSPTPPTDGLPIILWDCSANISDTRWAWSGTLGLQTLESRVWNTTGHCLDIPGGQFLAGRWTQLWGCNGTAAQKFIIGQVLLPPAATAPQAIAGPHDPATAGRPAGGPMRATWRAIRTSREM